MTFTATSLLYGKIKNASEGNAQGIDILEDVARLPGSVSGEALNIAKSQVNDMPNPLDARIARNVANHCIPKDGECN